jgi:hypothetical protein
VSCSSRLLRGSYWTWLFGPLLAVSAISLVSDAWVRGAIPLGRRFWVVEPVLYIAHGQSVDTPPGVAVAVAAIVFPTTVIVVRFLRRSEPTTPLTLELVAAAFLGGGLSNIIEVIATGSVTDFVGIRGSGGIYSAGDLGLFLGIAFFPIVVFAVTSQMARFQIAVLIGAAAYLLVFVGYVTDPRTFGVAILATIIVVFRGAASLGPIVKRWNESRLVPPNRP